MNKQPIGTIDRLIGDDAQLYKGDFDATALVGDGTGTIATMAAGIEALKHITSDFLVKITAKATSESLFGDLKVGDVYYSKKGDVAMKSGDMGVMLNYAKMADARNFTLTITSSEINVTTLADTVSKYRAGKGDATGSISFQTMTSEIVKDSIYNKFLKIVSVAANGAITVSDIDKGAIYVMAYLQAEGNGETQVFVFAQVELFGITLGADMGASQEYSSNVRLIGADPTIYVVETEAV